MVKKSNLKMSEFFLEVFTEEIPAKLQNDARNSLSDNFKKLFEEKKISSNNFLKLSDKELSLIHI